MNHYDELVEKGAKFLDERYAGWENSIDLKILDLSSDTACVTGQLSGDYGMFVSNHLIHGPDYGFSLSSGSYSLLTDAWRRVIAKRRNGVHGVCLLLDEMAKNHLIKSVYGDRIEAALVKLNKIAEVSSVSDANAKLERIREILDGV